jgi:hypothetical protein
MRKTARMKTLRFMRTPSVFVATGIASMLILAENSDTHKQAFSGCESFQGGGRGLRSSEDQEALGGKQCGKKLARPADRITVKLSAFA